MAANHKVPKFDAMFEGWVYRRVLDIPGYKHVDPRKWSHALAYTGGVDIDDQQEYEKKTGLDDIRQPAYDFVYATPDARCRGAPGRAR